MLYVNSESLHYDFLRVCLGFLSPCKLQHVVIFSIFEILMEFYDRDNGRKYYFVMFLKINLTCVGTILTSYLHLAITAPNEGECRNA